MRTARGVTNRGKKNHAQAAENDSKPALIAMFSAVVSWKGGFSKDGVMQHGDAVTAPLDPPLEHLGRHNSTVLDSSLTLCVHWYTPRHP